jgi:hypothetical protein
MVVGWFGWMVWWDGRGWTMGWMWMVHGEIGGYENGDVFTTW